MTEMRSPSHDYLRQAWRTASRALRRTRSSVRSLLLPPICAGCELDIDGDLDIPLCNHCLASFAMPPGPTCPRCSAPAPAASIRPEGCGNCDRTSFRFSRMIALGVYKDDLQAHIVRMKHNGEALSLVAGGLLARKVRAADWQSSIDLVVAPPMHWLRRISGGFHSADLIAEALAAELELPLASDLLYLTRLVQRQSSLPPSKRRSNLRKAFAVSRAYSLTGARILLVDDVLTTGATANAIAQVLRLAGAADVCVAVIARAVMN